MGDWRPAYTEHLRETARRMRAGLPAESFFVECAVPALPLDGADAYRAEMDRREALLRTAGARVVSGEHFARLGAVVIAAPEPSVPLRAASPAPRATPAPAPAPVARPVMPTAAEIIGIEWAFSAGRFGDARLLAGDWDEAVHAATHEAGHVVVAVAAGARVLSVSIIPAGTSGGRTRTDAWGAAVPSAAARGRALAAYALAGAVAHGWRFPGDFGPGYGADLAEARASVAEVHPGDEDAQQGLLRSALAFTDRVFRDAEFRHAAGAVRVGLLEHGELTGEEATARVLACLRPKRTTYLRRAADARDARLAALLARRRVA